jgi:hypothetical protein
MGYELRRWLRDNLPADCTTTERLVAQEIADLANDKTRRAYGKDLMSQLAQWTGLSGPKVVGNVLCKLAKRGWEFRVEVGKDKHGRSMYAYDGTQVEFLVPRGPLLDGALDAAEVHPEVDLSTPRGPSLDAERSTPECREVHPGVDPSPQGSPQESPQTGGTRPQTPRPNDPPSSDHWTENQRSISIGQDQPLGLVSDHRPRANTPPPPEPATPEPAEDRISADRARASPPEPAGPITTPITTPITAAAAAELEAAGEPIPRCDHGMHDVIRRDGRHACPACRRGLPAEPPAARASPARASPAAAADPPGQPDRPGRSNVLEFRPRNRSGRKPA